MKHLFSFSREAIVLLLVGSMAVGPLPAGEPLGGLPKGIAKLFGKTTEKTVHMNPPPAGKTPMVEELAKQIDWLEHHIETFGTAVPKQPDVWGESRMTRHREEFERELAKRFSEELFKDNLQGALRRADVSLFAAASAMTINQPGAKAADPNMENVQALILAQQPSGASATPAALDTFFKTGKKTDASAKFELTLEPTLHIDQLKRYLNNINQIRRVNEGDDTADSPGYALNVVHLPISVLPGKRTREGYGAEITITAEPHLTDDLLPRTFRNLVIHQSVEQLSLPLAQLFNNDPKLAEVVLECAREADRHANSQVRKLLAWADDWVRLSKEPGSKPISFAECCQDRNDAGVDILPSPAGNGKGRASNALRTTNTDDFEEYRDYLYKTSQYLETRFFELYFIRELNKRRKDLPCGILEDISTQRLTVRKNGEVLLRGGMPGNDSVSNEEGYNEFRIELSMIDIADWIDCAIKTRSGAAIPVTIYVPRSIVPESKVEIQNGAACCDKLPPLIVRIPFCIEISNFNSSNPIPGFQVNHERFDSLNKEAIKAWQEIVYPVKAMEEGKTNEPASEQKKGKNVEEKRPQTWIEMIQQAVTDLTDDAVLRYLQTQFASAKLNDLFPNTEVTRDLIDSVSFSPGAGQNASAQPMATSQVVPAHGTREFFRIAAHVRSILARTPVTASTGENLLTDIRGNLKEEAEAAYDFLRTPQGRTLWRFCLPGVAHAVRDRNWYHLDRWREHFEYMIPEGETVSLEVTPPNSALGYGRRNNSVTTALAWSIMVNSALLNERLVEDMRAVARAKGCGCGVDTEEWPAFYLPEPPPAPREGDDPELIAQQAAMFQSATEKFKEYVRCRWPVRVFALDPESEDQNIADMFSRRRELQLAVAVGVSKGNVSVNTASKFMRQLETDMNTIAINRTQVAFSHGSDTFGWRFYPRFQSPDTPSNLQAFGQNLFGGPDRDHDLRERQLEPGIRECTAVVVMPAFIPYVTFHSRTNWFSLTNPRERELTMSDTMMLSRNYQGMKWYSGRLGDSNCYRPGDVAHLHKVIEQIDRKMPLQQMLVEVPYENTTNGFELFSYGVTDLAPALHGWYGAPGIKVNVEEPACQNCKLSSAPAEPAAGASDDAKAAWANALSAWNDRCHCGTTLFLVGKHFSVLETKVIAGGVCCPDTRLISRSIMRVTIPLGVNTLEYTPACGGPKRRVVDVHLATPYGVTSHLLIPVVSDAPEPAPAVDTAKLKAEILDEARRPRIAVEATDPLIFDCELDRQGKVTRAIKLHESCKSKKVVLAYRENRSASQERVMFLLPDTHTSSPQVHMAVGVPTSRTLIADPVSVVIHPDDFPSKGKHEVLAATIETNLGPMLEKFAIEAGPIDTEKKGDQRELDIAVYYREQGDNFPRLAEGVAKIQLRRWLK